MAYTVLFVMVAVTGPNPDHDQVVTSQSCLSVRIEDRLVRVPHPHKEQVAGLGVRPMKRNKNEALMDHIH